jgi:hypothetical protein
MRFTSFPRMVRMIRSGRSTLHGACRPGGRCTGCGVGAAVSAYDAGIGASPGIAIATSPAAGFTVIDGLRQVTRTARLRPAARIAGVTASAASTSATRATAFRRFARPARTGEDAWRGVVHTMPARDTDAVGSAGSLSPVVQAWLARHVPVLATMPELAALQYCLCHRVHCLLLVVITHRPDPF